LQGWIAYFEWYPSHGEYAGLVVGHLVRDGRYNDALKVLKKCEESTGLDWGYIKVNENASNDMQVSQ